MAASAAAEVDLCASSPLTRAEIKQIHHHQALLSEERGSIVAYEDAQEDWLRHHAQAWRQARQSEALSLQLEEIRKHKWIESEKARRDLGTEAVLDWIKKHAAQWRSWYELEREGEHENS